MIHCFIMEETENLKTAVVAIIGRPSAGKSTFLNTACQEPVSIVSPIPQTTRNAIKGIVNTSFGQLIFIDTPGYPDFVGEMISALGAADSALIVVSAPSGMETGTEKAWLTVEDMGLPRAIFVNKMDREHADFDRAVDELRARFGSGIVPVQLPIGKEDTFQGVADLLTLHMKIVTHEDEELVADIPEFMQEAVEEARQQLIEALSDFDDKLMEKFLEGEEIPEDEIREVPTTSVRPRE